MNILTIRVKPKLEFLPTKPLLNSAQQAAAAPGENDPSTPYPKPREQTLCRQVFRIF
ncbi:MAG: hypothetical protein ACKVP1_08610 [Burkholderiaceae bacterium]